MTGYVLKVQRTPVYNGPVWLMRDRGNWHMTHVQSKAYIFDSKEAALDAWMQDSAAHLRADYIGRVETVEVPYCACGCVAIRRASNRYGDEFMICETCRTNGHYWPCGECGLLHDTPDMVCPRREK
jgi:hypothetical protein